MMPLQLAIPVSTGDLSANDLTHVKVERFRIDIENKRLEFAVNFGFYNEGIWSPGEYQPSVRRMFIVRDAAPEGGEGGSTDFTDLVAASTPLTLEEKLYDGVARTLYQWLIDNGHFDGSIV
jgi:hypothetical protein